MIRTNQKTRAQAKSYRLNLENLEQRHLLAANVVINEIHFDPEDQQSPSEFIEIYNAGDEVADLAGFGFSDGIEFQFEAGTTLNPGEYSVVTQDVMAYETVFGGASGPQIAYVVPSNTAGGQNFGGSLGMDFVVNSPIGITELGAFDSGSNGMDRTITVQLWSRNDSGTPSSPGDDTGTDVLAELTFTSADPGELVGGSRFKALTETLELDPGAYTIVASGYGFGELLQNGGGGGTGTTRSGGGQISFVGSSRWGNAAGVFPDNVDAHVHQYGAGTFVFEANSELPPFVPAAGQWVGKLNNDGELITLRDMNGKVIDQVDYGVGFPWPTLARGGGTSIELINPSLDNDLGGSWRSSGFSAFDTDDSDGGGPQDSVFFGLDESWRYFKGVQEPSSPVDAWREPVFDDQTWLVGEGPLGYGEGFVTTVLSDMRGGYSSVYFRREFEVIDPSSFDSLVLAARYDDAINVWINGTFVSGQNTSGEEVPFTGTSAANLPEDHSDRRIPLENHESYLVPGANVIAVQLLNASLGGSSDAFFDARLFVDTEVESQGTRPSPGRLNASSSVTAPPQIRQVDHTPSQPTSNDEIVVTAKITDPDGVGQVTLSYQLVDPGSYVPKSGTAYQTNWVDIVMNDDGIDGDAIAGDDVYSAVLPSTLQTHRRLVRYRIAVADTHGTTVQTPYADDAQSNFAYFVYDGVPAWTGADRPGVTDQVTYGTEITNSLPAFHLISQQDDVLDSQYNTSFNTKQFRFEGTLVVGDTVYDHIRYRIRGQNSTYVAGKNKWKIRFNRTHYFQGSDQYGNPWPEKLRTLNLGTNASPWAPGNRGLAGMDEALAFKLFAKVGVAAANVTAFQLRVIDSAEEASTTNQYEGDLWGLYLAFENPEKQFLNAHDLPDGNLFRMQGGRTELENHGFGLPGDLSDVNSFTSGAGYNRNPSQPIAWWRDNVDLDGYYSFRSVMEAINHNDIRDRENMLLYFNPESEKWSMLPWDVDLLYEEFDRWGPDGVQNASPIEQFRKSLVHDEINIEFQNRSRELQDLLLNDDQGWAFIEEYARYVEPFAAIDRAMWDYNPRASSSPANGQHRGAFYNEVYNYPGGNGAAGEVRRAISPVGFEGMVNWVKEFISLDGFGGGQLAVLNLDADIPVTPTITFAGTAGFPADDLRFSTSSFADPQGNETFAAMQWRLGEVSDPNALSFDPDAPREYEIDAVWDSGQFTEFSSQVTIPGNAVEPGHAYRARVRMQDTTGRWSHWSTPVQFVATASDTSDVQRYLRITELNYNPDGRSSVGSPDGSEFIELSNISSGAEAITLDLSGAAITQGPSEPFVFSPGTLLAPGDYTLVVKDQSEFAANYPTNSTTIAGEYAGSLSNGGELVRLVDANGGVVMSVEYEESGLWPKRADGAGATLELVDPRGVPAERLGKHYSWRGSTRPGGSPGEHGDAPVGILINEILANTDGSNAFDAIELFNSTDQSIDIGGWFLSDAVGDLLKFQIPMGTTLGGGGYIVFDENNFNPTPETPGPKDFALDGSNGDDVWLVVSDGSEHVASFVDDLHFGASESGHTIGRTTPDTGELTAFARSTLGCENSHIRVSPIVVSEIQYAPSLPSTTALAIEPELDGNDLEYIELVSDSSEPVDIGGWRIRGGVDLDIPVGTMIRGTVVVVSFDPDGPLNADRAAAFRAHYALSSQVALIGGYSGSLSNSGEQIRLERPDIPPVDDPTLRPFVAVDTITYDELAPWPTSALATGDSIQRSGPTFLGNDGRIWRATTASPGTADFSDSLPGDFNADEAINERDLDALLDAVNRGVQWSTYDLDSDGQVTQDDAAALLASIGALPGDSNLDGVVNAVDLNRLGINWQRTHCMSWDDGDFNGDGAVTAVDLNTLGVNWQQAAAQPSSVVPVRRPRAPLAISVAIVADDEITPQKVDKVLRGDNPADTESSEPPLPSEDSLWRRRRDKSRQGSRARRNQLRFQDDVVGRTQGFDEVFAKLAW